MISVFNSITGTVSRKIPGLQASVASQLCLSTAGIEWIFETSRTSLSQWGELGREATVFAYLVHREDQMYLCGFASERERSMFLDLLKVEGIGPRQALKILSATTPERLGLFLEAGDVDGLETLPGLGKKTAQKMVLALKGKLSLDSDSAPQGGQGASAGEYEDLVVALVAMGYERKSILELLPSLAPEYAALSKHERESELMRRLIVELS